MEAVIGQVDEPFQVTLLYISCGREDRAMVALDSLEIINCESGEICVQPKNCNLFVLTGVFHHTGNLLSDRSQ